jgi:hypothetical protein
MYPQLFVTILTLIAPLCISAAEVYKWIDDNGTVHFSDKPQHKSASKIHVWTTAPQLMQEDALPSAAPDELSVDERIDARRAKRLEQEAELKKKKQNCRKASAYLATLESHPRLVDIGEDGKEHYFSGPERDQAITKARQVVSKWCH